MKNLALTLGCSLIWLVSAGSVFAQSCWSLTPAGACSDFGPRIPDYGCNGCGYMWKCVNHTAALRSLPEPLWSEVLPARMDVEFESGWEVTPTVRRCAVYFDCFPDCYFSFEHGQMMCFQNTVSLVWDLNFDSLVRECYPITT